MTRRTRGWLPLLAVAVSVTACGGGGGRGSGGQASIAATASGTTGGVGSGTTGAVVSGSKVTKLGPFDSFAGLADPTYASSAKNVQASRMPRRRIHHLAYPVMGFPSLVEPTGRINLKVHLSDGGKTNDFRAEIVMAASAAPARFALTVLGPPQYDATSGVYTVTVHVPEEAIPAVYDLEVSSASFTSGPRTEVQRNAVRVLDPARRDPSFAVIGDPQLQDIRTILSPDVLRAFLAEVRLRDPDFILFVGDLNFGSDYVAEYDQNIDVFAGCGLPIFFVPGNHDGYATVVDNGNGTTSLERDGLHAWRTTIGPLLYSFDWRGHHFVGVNSMGGSPERRNSSGILVANYGGLVETPELDWIERDVAAAAARGKRSALFMHHDPSQPITPDIKAVPFPILKNGDQEWNDKASQDRIDRIIGSHDVSHVFYGHIHKDRLATRKVNGKDVTYVGTTTILCGTRDMGYRWIQTRADLISEVNAGPARQSVIFVRNAVNVEATYSGARDGRETALEARVRNDLDVETRVAVELAVRPSPTGLAVHGGALLGLATAENGSWVARVQGRAGPRQSPVFRLEPAASGGALPNGGSPGSSTGAPGTIGNTVLKKGPAITLTSPLQGTQTTATTANVSGTIQDPRSVASIFVAGKAAALDVATGRFVAQVALSHGLNVIVVEAFDTSGRRSKQTVSVVQGTFAPTSDPVKGALHAHLGPDGLAAVARETASRLPPGAVAAQIMARNPLVHTSLTVAGLTIASAHVEATKASTGNPAIKLAPAPADLALEVEVPNVAVNLSARSFGGVPYSVTGSITARRAVVRARATVAIANGAPRTTLKDVKTTLDGFDWKVNGIPSAITNLVESLVRKELEDVISSKIAAHVPPELDKVLATRHAFSQTVLGSRASFSFRLSSARTGIEGVSFGFDGNCSVVSPSVTPKASPGSLVSNGGAPELWKAAPRGFAASVDEDLMNRAGHETWRTGVADFTIDRATAPRLGLPAWLPLDFGLIGNHLSALKGKLPASDPIAFVVSPRLPPIFRARPGAAPIEAGLGDLVLEIWHLPPAGGRNLIVRLALHVRARATANVSAAGLVDFALTSPPAFEVSVQDSPIAPDLDPVSLSNLVQFALPPILTTAANRWSGYKLPLLGGAPPRNVDVKADGPRGTFVTVKGDL